MTKHIIIDFKKGKMAIDFQEMLSTKGIDSKLRIETIPTETYQVSFFFDGYVSFFNALNEQNTCAIIFFDEVNHKITGEIIIHKKDVTEIWL